MKRGVEGAIQLQRIDDHFSIRVPFVRSIIKVPAADALEEARKRARSPKPGADLSRQLRQVSPRQTVTGLAHGGHPM